MKPSGPSFTPDPPHLIWNPTARQTRLEMVPPLSAISYLPKEVSEKREHKHLGIQGVNSIDINFGPRFFYPRQ